MRKRIQINFNFWDQVYASQSIYSGHDIYVEATVKDLGYLAFIWYIISQEIRQGTKHG